jgi:tripeptide aminopeptidase
VTVGARGDAFGADEVPQALDLVRQVCEVPAPTFDEARRASFVATLLGSWGYAPRIDAAGNVVTDLPGGRGPRVALVSHLDTVFSADVDTRVTFGNDGRWYAPGIGDNSSSIAVLLAFAAREAAAVRGHSSPRPRPRTMLAFTVGEEGLGDLRGAKAFVADHGSNLDAFVAIDGHLGSVVDRGVGSSRVRAQFRGPGGHSWGDFPQPSAAHAAAEAVHALARMPLPSDPRSSWNVGRIEGGTTINAIAERAQFDLDLRSIDEAVLATLDREARKRIVGVARRHRVEVDLLNIGRRPAGRNSDPRWTEAALAAARSHGVEPSTSASSTDANAAMASGLASICFGVYAGGDAHREGEWIDPSSLAIGAAVLDTFLASVVAF